MKDLINGINKMNFIKTMIFMSFLIGSCLGLIFTIGLIQRCDIFVEQCMIGFIFIFAFLLCLGIFLNEVVFSNK